MIAPIVGHAAHLFHNELRVVLQGEAVMTAYLIALALAGLVVIAVWEGFT